MSQKSLNSHKDRQRLGFIIIRNAFTIKIYSGFSQIWEKYKAVSLKTFDFDLILSSML